MRKSLLSLAVLAAACSEPNDVAKVDGSADLVSSLVTGVSVRLEGDSLWVKGTIQPWNDFLGPYTQHNRLYRKDEFGVPVLEQEHFKPFKTFADSFAVADVQSGENVAGSFCSTQRNSAGAEPAYGGSCKTYNYTRP